MGQGGTEDSRTNPQKDLTGAFRSRVWRFQCQPLQEAEKYHYSCCQLTKMSFFHNSHCAISNYHECLYWTKHSTQVQACGEQQTQKPEFKTFPWGNFSEGLRDQRPSARLFDPVHFTQTVMSVLLLRDAASQCTRHRLRLQLLMSDKRFTSVWKSVCLAGLWTLDTQARKKTSLFWNKLHIRYRRLNKKFGVVFLFTWWIQNPKFTLAAKCSSMFSSSLITVFVCWLVLSKWCNVGFKKCFLWKQLPVVAENDTKSAVTVNQNSKVLGRTAIQWVESSL